MLQKAVAQVAQEIQLWFSKEKLRLALPTEKRKAMRKTVGPSRQEPMSRVSKERPTERPTTKFERRGERLGHGVWDLKFERVD